MRGVPLDGPWKKDINRYRFLIFKFWSWIFGKSSKFWASKYNNASKLLLLWLTFCIKSFLPTGWRTFIWYKNPLLKCCTILVWIAGCWNSSSIILTSGPPKNNCWLSRIFGGRFGGKDCGLCPFKIQPVYRRCRRIRGIFVCSGSELTTLFEYLRPNGLCPFQDLVSNGTTLMQV